MPPRNDIVTVQEPAKGSLLSQAIDTRQLRDSFIRMILYGRNRVGKTTLACQFPKPLLLVSFEPSLTGGAMSVKKMDGVKFFHVHDVETAHGLAVELKDDKFYQTVVLDTASSMQAMVLKGICGWERQPVQASYGMVDGDQYRARSEQTREIIDRYLDVPKHIIITAKEKDHNPPKEEKYTKAGKLIPDMRPKFLRGVQSKSFIAPEVGGATVEWLQDACDYICRMYAADEIVTKTTEAEVMGTIQKSTSTYETGRYIRYLRTQLHENYAAGFRSPVPENVPAAIIRPTYDKILKVMRGQRLSDEDAQYDPEI